MGGKQNLLPRYESEKFFPDKKFNRFVDLFCGACSVSLEVARRYPNTKILLNDQNTELMQLYSHIKGDFFSFCEIYERLSLSLYEAAPADRKSIYLDFRQKYAEFEGSENTVGESAALLVMLKNNFNGLWRASKAHKGRYYTSPGKINKKLKPLSIANLVQFHEFLQRCELRFGSYQTLKTRSTDWVYADPPYRGCRDGGTYGVDFSDAQSIEVCQYLSKTRGMAAMSNLDAGDNFWQEHLPGFSLRTFASTHKCGIGGAGPDVSEALIKNY